MTQKLFHRQHFHDYSDRCRHAAYDCLEKIDPDTLLSSIDTEIIDSLFQQQRMDEIKLNVDQRTMRSEERQISVSDVMPFNPYSHDYRPGGLCRLIKRQVVTPRIPYSGSKGMFDYLPSPTIHFTPEVNLTNDAIEVDIINMEESADYLKRHISEFQERLIKQVGALNNQIRAYNNTLPQLIRCELESRKTKIRKYNEIAAALNIPVIKQNNVSKTLQVPVEQKTLKLQLHSPDSFAPDPVLDQVIYDAILQLLHDWGKVMERHPDTYRDKGEDAIRNLLLLLLTPHFKKASVTGETFNYQGKTDILIKHENSNLFVAECKFWNGERKLHETVDQLLSYLAWRDSKAAVIMFVDRNDMTAIDSKVKDSMTKHPQFLKYVDSKAEGFHRYEFKMKSDPSKRLYLSVLLFHFREP